jgi:diacylglycerol kinase family enzyme
MKKLLTVLCGVVIALSLFATTGNTVQAEECGCDVTPIFGAEKNKIVATLISSPEFKSTKFSLKSDGYTWRGAKNIEVIVNNTYGGMIMIAVPYLNNNGTVEMAVFFDGVFMGVGPM